MRPHQFSLFPTKTPEYPKDATIDENFAIFHTANPHVYENLKILAFRAKRAKKGQCGIALLVEQLRWTYYIRTDHKASEYMINNSFRSRYSRLLMEQEPELKGFFEVRKLTSLEEVG